MADRSTSWGYISSASVPGHNRRFDCLTTQTEEKKTFRTCRKSFRDVAQRCKQSRGDPSPDHPARWGEGLAAIRVERIVKEGRPPHVHIMWERWNGTGRKKIKQKTQHSARRTAEYGALERRWTMGMWWAEKERRFVCAVPQSLRGKTRRKVGLQAHSPAA